MRRRGAWLRIRPTDLKAAVVRIVYDTHSTRQKDMTTAPVPGGRRQAALIFIVITILIDFLGIGLIIPVLPEIVADLTRGTTYSPDLTYGVLAGVYALMQFLFAPLIGALSDHIGRRPVLLASILGLGIDYLLIAWAPTLGWLFLGRVIAGITAANVTAANAYIADITPPEDRVKSFGLIGAAFGIGFILGPALGGLLGEAHPRLPFLVAAGLATLNFLYGYFILPESLPPERRTPRMRWRFNPFVAIAGLRRYPAVLALAFTILCINLADQALRSTWVLYTGARFGWGPLDNGLSLTAVGVFAAIVQGGLIGRIARRLGEVRTFMLGVGAGVVSMTLYGFTTQGWMMYSIMAIGALSGVALPSAQAIVTGQVDPQEQGAVQGALASLASISAIVAPPLATYLFSTYSQPERTPYIPGIAFFFGAALLLIGLLFGIRQIARPPATQSG